MRHPRGTQKAPRKHPGGTQDFLSIQSTISHPAPRNVRTRVNTMCIKSRSQVNSQYTVQEVTGQYTVQDDQNTRIYKACDATGGQVRCTAAGHDVSATRAIPQTHRQGPAIVRAAEQTARRTGNPGTAKERRMPEKPAALPSTCAYEEIRRERIKVCAVACDTIMQQKTTAASTKVSSRAQAAVVVNRREAAWHSRSATNARPPSANGTHKNISRTTAG